MKSLWFAPLCGCFLAWFATVATAAEAGTATNDAVVARGAGFEIRRSDMDHVLKSVTVNNPGDRLPPDSEIRVVNQLIEVQLVLQKASAAELAAGARAADFRLAELRQTWGGPEFERRLQATGMTAETLRRMIAQEMTAQASLTRQLGIHVTDADARQIFDRQPPGSYDHPARARIRELVLLTTSDYASSSAPPLPAAVIQAKHRQIFELYARVRAGEDLAALARRYNEDPLSKGADDTLTFKRSEMDFGDLAFAMATNQISGVLTNADGYRIFQLLAIIPAQKIGFADVADKIKASLIGSQKRRLAPAYLEKLRKEAGVEILDPQLQPMAAAESQPPPPAAGQ